jgi:hypothetical protein
MFDREGDSAATGAARERLPLLWLFVRRERELLLLFTGGEAVMSGPRHARLLM